MVGSRGRRSKFRNEMYGTRVQVKSEVLFRLLLASCFMPLFGASTSLSQEITAKASTDKTQYLVGDYINYTIVVSCGKDFKIYPPSFVPDSLKSVTLIEKEKPDEEEENGIVNVAFKYVLSGYDSTGVLIPSIAVPYQTSSDSTTHFAYTNPVSFTIQTLKVNPQGEIKDVNPPIKILLNWKLVLFWVLAALFFVGIFLYSYLVHRMRKTKSPLEKEIERLPSHVVALNALRELEKRQLWQKGKIMEYHSEITEIIRRYFEERFNMPAMELPTSETIEVLGRNRETGPILSTTYDFLSNADLVKFAKFTPLNSINEEMMKQANEIVNKTIPVAQAGQDSPVDPKQETEGIRLTDAG
ncbi:MAG TPA: hypothetical protein VLX91_14335 [Candidatus Acidoferrales bacterium]|nr:hypothetical protein [Candidatus Acidoferrales bacterium]